MSRSRALFLSAALTAFALVVIGAAVGRSVDEPEPSSTDGAPSLPQGASLVGTAAPPRPTEPTEPTAARPLLGIAPGRAVEAALQSSPGSRALGPPELVVYDGRDAYEVLLDRGPVYVDARSGAFLSSWVTTSNSATRRVDDDDEHHDRERNHRREHHREHDDD